MRRISTFFSIALIVVAGTVSCNNDPKADGLAQIKSFSLQSSLNQTLSSNVTGAIDETAKTISLVLPEGSGSSFIPTFTATDDDVVKAGSTVVTSGVTSISVTDGTKLTVTDEVSELTSTYTLSVKENDGAAELKSVSFLKADNAVLTDDVAPEAIASEMIARVPAAAFRQELTISVEAGLNDVVKIGGKEAEGGKAKVDTSFPIDITVTDAVAGTSANYVLKVGKVLEYVVTKVASISDGTKIFGSIDLAINPKDGNPWIAYYKEIDGDKLDRVAVQRFDGTSFSFVGDSYIKPDPDAKDAKQPTLAFASDGTAYLKYIGGEVNNKNTVRKYTTTWEVVGNASLNSVNITATFPSPHYIQSDGTPAFFFTNNTNPNKRTIGSAYYNGSEWVEKLNASASGIAPAFGEGPTSSAGWFYSSCFTTFNGKIYMLASFNMWGYFVYEVGNGCTLTPVVYDFKPGESEYGVPTNFNIATDGDDLFVYACDVAAAKMQVYKVNFTDKKLVEYGEGILGNSSSSGVSEASTFSVSPTGLVVAAVEDAEHAVTFKYLNSSLQWENFTLTENALNNSASGEFRIAFNSDGVGYIAYPGETDDAKIGNIEVYKIALEADILPE